MATHFSAATQVLTVSGGANKRLFASIGAILIDDSQRNPDAWELAGGIGVLHTNTTTTLETMESLCPELRASAHEVR